MCNGTLPSLRSLFPRYGLICSFLHIYLVVFRRKKYSSSAAIYLSRTHDARLSTQLSITEYLTLPKKPDDPQFQGVFHQQRRAGKGIGWHGFKLLYNPLCAEFGIRTAQELEDFIRDDLPEFAMVRL